jgi:hypothetical protein
VNPCKGCVRTFPLPQTKHGTLAAYVAYVEPVVCSTSLTNINHPSRAAAPRITPWRFRFPGRGEAITTCTHARGRLPVHGTWPTSSQRNRESIKGGGKSSHALCTATSKSKSPAVHKTREGVHPRSPPKFYQVTFRCGNLVLSRLWAVESEFMVPWCGVTCCRNMRRVTLRQRFSQNANQPAAKRCSAHKHHS